MNNIYQKDANVRMNEISLTTSKLELYFDDLHIGTGTCFFWIRRRKPYIVTNWHNFSGVNPISGENLDKKNGSRPNKVKFWFSRGDNPQLRPWTQNLESDHGDKLWLEHPHFGRKIDVACLPLIYDGRDGVATLFPLSELPDSIIQPCVSSEVFVLGYPKFIDCHGLPIWKRGSIATEPGHDVDGLPKLLIDTATMRGMSGSPVIMHTHHGRMEDGRITIGNIMTRFIGVYSGRVDTDGEGDVQLGLVWKERVIDEIIKCGRRAPNDI